MTSKRGQLQCFQGSLLKAANLVQLIWEQCTDRWLRVSSQSSDVPCSDYLRDWSRVHTRLDPSNCGSVRIDGWLDLAQHVIFAPTENLEASEAWQTSSRDEFCFMAVLVWFAVDTRENGELLTSLFLAWLRRLAAAPTIPIHEISDVHLMVNRGLALIKGGAAMVQSYLIRLEGVRDAYLRRCESGDSSCSGELPTNSHDAIKSQHKEEIDSIPTDWSKLVDHKFSSNAYIGGRMLAGKLISVKDSVTGKPVNAGAKAPDAFKTIACIHFQTTVKDESDFSMTHAGVALRKAPVIEIVEIACVLVNRKTLLIVDEFHSYVRPQHKSEFSKLFYAMTEAPRQRIEAMNGFAQVWHEFEEWLLLRNVLTSKHESHEENPTLFVAEEARQHASFLCSQLQLLGRALPRYLEKWVDLDLVFKRRFRCGKCSRCTTRIEGECSARFLVPSMIQVVRSVHWQELASQYQHRRGDEHDALIDLMRYGVHIESFDPIHHHTAKSYTRKDDLHLTNMQGHLYKLKECVRGGGGGGSEGGEMSREDSIVDWQLRLFKIDGYSLSCQQDDSEGGLPSVEYRLLTLADMEYVQPASCNAQAFSFEVAFANKKLHRRESLLLAAETEDERARWILALSTVAAIRKEGGFAVEQLLQQGVSAPLAQRAPKLLHFWRRPSAGEEVVMRSWIESGLDEHLAKAIREEEGEAIDDMQATLASLGIDADIAGKCANSLSTVFEAYRTGSAVPAGGALQYCREMAIVAQALVAAGLDLRETSHLKHIRMHQLAKELMPASAPRAQPAPRPRARPPHPLPP